MTSRHPPRFVVRTLADATREARKRWLLLGAWSASLIIVGLIVWMLVGHGPAAVANRGDARALGAENEELRQQVANLQRAGQVAGIAAKELTRNLAERDEEISGLRTDLAFYSRLVGGNGQRDGLKVQGARTEPVKGSPNAWNVVITLTQNARRGEVLKGSLTLAVEGIQGSKVATLEGPALGQAAPSPGLPFSFKYFQQIQGSFTLPAGFKPTRLRIVASADGDEPVTSTIPWADATRNDEVNDVQQ
ncbi:hypothetical protein C8J98_101598 [Luteibacter sp. OK325]|uniref:DUF6776 family protein n=1 Tax=Luteibacter sp. OK325 TaxID=2135670 RepID=UPI000D38CDBF|nr:DUF6776 family protein [Luteibacter sp. OK325]PTR35334.1 hypothetical protein C8J98_101598 [Luteibacter sp. OK325]